MDSFSSILGQTSMDTNFGQCESWLGFDEFDLIYKVSAQLGYKDSLTNLLHNIISSFKYPS